MNKEQASWLIVRAFGVYLLIQAFILGLGILGQIYTVSMYNKLASSLGTDSNYITPILLTYRSSLPAWLLKFVLYLAAGTYLLRRGRFLMRWLQHVPDAPHHDTKAPLTEGEATEMSVKQRLSAAGLFQEFADAVERRDVPELERILRQIYLTPDDIQTVIAQMLRTSP
jgi:hypothetical protein